MTTAAKKRGVAKYKKEKCKSLVIRFYPTDMELLDYIKSKDNMAQYIKGLVRDEMNSAKEG